MCVHALAPTKRVNVKPLARMNRYILRYLTDFMLKCQSDRRPCCNQRGVVLIEQRDSLFCKIFLRIDFVALYFIGDVESVQTRTAKLLKSKVSYITYVIAFSFRLAIGISKLLRVIMQHIGSMIRKDFFAITLHGSMFKRMFTTLTMREKIS